MPYHHIIGQFPGASSGQELPLILREKLARYYKTGSKTKDDTEERAPEEGSQESKGKATTTITADSFKSPTAHLDQHHHEHYYLLKRHHHHHRRPSQKPQSSSTQKSTDIDGTADSSASIDNHKDQQNTTIYTEAELEEQLRHVSQSLLVLQQQIQKGEEVYLEESHGHGNVWTGWDSSYVDATLTNISPALLQVDVTPANATHVSLAAATAAVNAAAILASNGANGNASGGGGGGGAPKRMTQDMRWFSSSGQASQTLYQEHLGLSTGNTTSGGGSSSSKQPKVTSTRRSNTKTTSVSEMSEEESRLLAPRQINNKVPITRLTSDDTDIEMDVDGKKKDGDDDDDDEDNDDKPEAKSTKPVGWGKRRRTRGDDKEESESEKEEEEEEKTSDPEDEVGNDDDEDEDEEEEEVPEKAPAKSRRKRKITPPPATRRPKRKRLGR